MASDEVSSAEPPESSAEPPCEELEVHRLHIGGLPTDITDEELPRRFQPFGEVLSSEVVRNSDDGQSRGFGYVTLRAFEAEVQRCVKAYTGTRWRGQKLAVGVANESYMDRLQREWAEQLEVDEAAAVYDETHADDTVVEVCDPKAAVHIRAGPFAALVEAKPGVTNKHKRSFGVPASLAAKSLPYLSDEEEALPVHAAAPDAGAASGDEAAGGDDPVSAGDDGDGDDSDGLGDDGFGDDGFGDDGFGDDGSGDGASAEDGSADGSADDAPDARQPKRAATTSLKPPVKKMKPAAPLTAAAPAGMEDELAEAELFMRGKAKARKAVTVKVI